MVAPDLAALFVLRFERTSVLTSSILSMSVCKWWFTLRFFSFFGFRTVLYSTVLELPLAASGLH
jgi:hypothetical protein